MNSPSQKLRWNMATQNRSYRPANRTLMLRETSKSLNVSYPIPTVRAVNPGTLARVLRPSCHSVNRWRTSGVSSTRMSTQSPRPGSRNERHLDFTSLANLWETIHTVQVIEAARGLAGELDKVHGKIGRDERWLASKRCVSPARLQFTNSQVPRGMERRLFQHK
jgi:hypothetical protein